MGLTFDKLVLKQGTFCLHAEVSIPQGLRVAVIGPSGAGKSTLLAAIAGFLNPASGRILWSGKDITGLAPGIRPLSILFQDGNLFPHLTVTQNIGLGLSSDLRLSHSQRADLAKVMTEVGLADKGARKPAELSGGEQSRVALARVLLRARPVLLLDEPFAALGPALKAQMLALVDRIARETGATVLMVTHDPEDARRLCSHTIVVAEGVVAAPAPTGPILDNPPPALRAYLRG